MSIVAPEQLSTPRYCQICGHFLVERYIAAERRRRLQCEACGFIHYLNPRVVVSIIVEHGGKVLLHIYDGDASLHYKPSVDLAFASAAEVFPGKCGSAPGDKPHPAGFGPEALAVGNGAGQAEPPRPQQRA